MHIFKMFNQEEIDYILVAIRITTLIQGSSTRMKIWFRTDFSGMYGRRIVAYVTSPGHPFYLNSKGQMSGSACFAILRELSVLWSLVNSAK